MWGGQCVRVWGVECEGVVCEGAVCEWAVCEVWCVWSHLSGLEGDSLQCSSTKMSLSGIVC